jgi:threonine dehydrogenase-like Zn-dependent dehydrogenase
MRSARRKRLRNCRCQIYEPARLPLVDNHAVAAYHRTQASVAPRMCRLRGWQAGVLEAAPCGLPTCIGGGWFRMQALVWEGPRRLVLADVADPVPGPNDTLLRVRGAGICGSELEGYLGQSSLRVPPLVMGHEFSGEILALPPNHATGLRVGQLVTANPLIPCGVCPICQAGRSYLCPRRTLIGAHRPGAFAEYVAVPLDALIPLPETVAAPLGALSEPLAVALHAVGRARRQAGTPAVVWGAGSIGLLTIWAAWLAGADPIVAVESNPARLAAAAAIGASTTVDGRDPGAITAVRRAVEGHPFVTVFDAVGRTETRQSAAQVADPGGQVVLIGLHDAETSFAVNALVRAEITLVSAYGYTHAELRRAVEVLATESLPTTAWIEVRPLATGPATFGELLDAPGAVTKIVLAPS